MNGKRILNWLITILLIILFMKLIKYVIIYWYISVPIMMALYYYIRRRFRILAGKIYKSSQQNSQHSSEQDEVIEAEYTVVEEDEKD